MSIRRATLDDVPAIVEISNRAALETAANFATEPESLASWTESFHTTHEAYPWLVAADDGACVIGFAKASPWKGRCAYAYSAEISVYVRPEHHRRGIGRALYDVLFPVLRDQGYRCVLAGITLPNPASVRLHESFGMVRAAFFQRIGWKFGRWHDVGYWQRLMDDESTAPTNVRGVREVMADRESAQG